MFENAPPSAGEVRALANQLLSWADHLSARAATETSLTEGEQRELALGIAEALRDAAILRTRHFSGMPLGNLAWEVILELFVRTQNGFRVTRESLVLDSGAPADELIRAIEQLCERGLVVKAPDRFDPNITGLALSEEGSRDMITFLTETNRFIRVRTAALDGLAPAPSGVSHSA